MGGGYDSPMKNTGMEGCPSRRRAAGEKTPVADQVSRPDPTSPWELQRLRPGFRRDAGNMALADRIAAAIRRDAEAIAKSNAKGLTLQDCLYLRLVESAMSAVGLEAEGRDGKPIPRGDDRIRYLLDTRMRGVLSILLNCRPDVLHAAAALWPNPWTAFTAWLRGPLDTALEASEAWNAAIAGGGGFDEAVAAFAGVVRRGGEEESRMLALSNEHDKMLRSLYARDERLIQVAAMALMNLSRSRSALIDEVGGEDGVNPYDLDDAAAAAENERPTPGLDFHNWPIRDGLYSPGPQEFRDALDKGLRRMKAIQDARRDAEMERLRKERERADRNRRLAKRQSATQALREDFRLLRYRMEAAMPKFPNDPATKGALYVVRRDRYRERVDPSLPPRKAPWAAKKFAVSRYAVARRAERIRALFTA